MHFKMSSAICFNLDQSKILSSGNGLRNAPSLVLHSIENLSLIRYIHLIQPIRSCVTFRFRKLYKPECFLRMVSDYGPSHDLV